MTLVLQNNEFVFHCAAPYLNLSQLKSCNHDNRMIKLNGKRISFNQTLSYAFSHIDNSRLWSHLMETNSVPTAHSSSPNTFNNSIFPDSTLMRFYWEKELQWNKTLKTNTVLQKCYFLCQRLIDTLPGEKRCCNTCQWTVPLSDFHNDTTCTFCTDYNSYKLAILQNRAYLKPNDKKQ